MKTISLIYTVLIIDDDAEVRRSLVHLFERAKWQVSDLPNAVDAAKKMIDINPDLVISDVKMPGISGLQLFEEVFQTDQSTPFIFVSAHADVAMAVKAMQQGAYSFLEKPFDPKRLLMAAQNAAKQCRLQRQNNQLHAQIAALSGLDQMLLGNNPALVKVRGELHQYAQILAPVMLHGETGSGKELAARALHNLSQRSTQPFITVDCSAMASDHFSVMMFGSSSQETCYLQAAEGGTLFLDEPSALSNDQQAALLRVVDTGEYHQCDSIFVKRANVRIVSATNGNIEQQIALDSLREDLAFRLNNFSITMPSLRDFSDDIYLLFNYFSEYYYRLYDIPLVPLDVDDISSIMTYSWPGNVRELKHLAQRRVVRSQQGDSSVSLVMSQIKGTHENSNKSMLRPAVAAFERALIAQSLIEHAGKMEVVANTLGIGRRTLNEKMVKLGLEKSNLL
jgi:two-component system C4-dicarboxylate transport response regulator DctD|tara:strand:- start:17322 stop:18674 length:1353 start_codon:yes stop_codon:yes gene_type:complete